MNNQPLVSIVTPSYNQAQFIAETIESVLSQSYPRIEYIIIDGGSTDDTLDVIRQYEDNPHLSWISEPDRGMADALNKGFARCTGDIMGWLNSDDMFIGQPVADTVAYLNAHPDADLVYGDAVYTDRDGLPMGKQQSGRPFDFIRTLSYLNCVPQPGTFWRRSLWEKAGLLREDLHYSLDSEYWLRMSRFGNLHYCPGDRATYRLHEATKTAQEERAALEAYHLTLEIVNDRETYPELQSRQRLILSNRYFMLAKTYVRLNKPKEARQFAAKALWLSPIRRRWPAIAMFYIDMHLGTNLAEGLNTLWNHLKRRA